ncbi:ATP-dependent helicase [uncultured Bifidobacterium sp.]|uniref:ATP-dependent helicase n=1 Tax=uncultured Bifidobacterium sp. TaxID=165187 RepID=UPI0026377DEE|nr:ATP-dependent helicase [uncultured Bifidobacterium sp.]
MHEDVERILEGLDDDQRLAATSVEGPVRIVAVAGAGKTRTITRRIAYACASGLWDPDKVLAVTFSVKAASEMRSRLTSLGVGEAVRAATFHSAALRQLRRVWPDLSDGPFPRVLEDQHDLVARSLARVLIDEGLPDSDVRDVQAEINWCKTSLIAPEDYPRVCAASSRRPPAGLGPDRFVEVYSTYEQEKSYRGRIDFDDILLLLCHVLDAYPEVARRIRGNVGWLTVDEFQDVSPVQYRLMRLWLGTNRNVCVVGDPAQTIYSFAGATSHYLMEFPRDFAPVSEDVVLRTDYRSTPQVVSWANRILGASPDRDDYIRLSPVRDKGRRVTRTVYETDDEEAQGVARSILRLVDSGVRPSDCAILTRINAQQSVVCDALRLVGLRYRVRRDAQWDEGGSTEESRRAALESLGLPVDGGAVTISTIHAAKGLEFAHVFVVGCSEGLMPYGGPTGGDSLEEERRLLYVAVTRARDSLHFSYASGVDGRGSVREPSRFL